jgi:hypothetical protein
MACYGDSFTFLTFVIVSETNKSKLQTEPPVYIKFEVFLAVTTEELCLLGCYTVWLL